jgi:8-amino-7-oxononanoate synthase
MGARRGDVESIVDLLGRRAVAEPERRVYSFLVDGEAHVETFTHAALDRVAKATAALLQDRTNPGDRVLLLLPPGLDYVAAVYGCLCAGVVAVPAPPPSPSRPERGIARLRKIVADSGTRLLLTVSAIGGAIQQHAEGLGRLEWLAMDDLPEGVEQSWRHPSRSVDDLAVLQYTSGSTSEPNGVMLSQANLLAHLRYLRRQLALTRDVEGVLWLPTFHDMGLVGGIFLALFNGHHVTLMNPWHFLQRPGRWLEAMSRVGATHTAAPNFALDLCVRKTTAEQREELDLRSLRMVLSGGEQVRADSIAAFVRAFAPAGLRPTALTPAYGLAEATLMVTTVPVDSAPKVGRFDARALLAGAAKVLPNGEAQHERGPGRELVGCGGPDPATDLRIVDPRTGRGSGPGQVGEIWVRGPGVAAGYWNRPDLTARTFGAILGDTGEGPFLRTGDLGFVLEGELYVTGRLKDLIVIHGLNHYPQDIETTVERVHPALLPGGSVAFGTEIDGEERLVVVSEVDADPAPALDVLAGSIQAAVGLEHGVHLHRLALIPPKSVPKTTSGKLQRGLTRQMLAGGEFGILLDWRRPSEPSLHQEIEGDGRYEEVVAWILEEVRGIAGDGQAEFSEEVPLAMLGLDSIQLADLVQRIETRFRTPLPITEVPHEVSILQLADYATGRSVLTLPATGDGPVRATSGSEGDGAVAAPSERSLRRRPFLDLPEFEELEQRITAFSGLGIDNPFFRLHQGVAHDTALIDGRELVNFASYNYLNLCGHPDVSRAAKRAIDSLGTSVSASRLVSGERPIHQELEAEIADFLGTEDAVVFVSGNLANVTTLGHLARASDLIVHDALAHDSIVRGALLSGATRRSFPHNDWRALDGLLDAVRDRFDRVIVAIEGVYSMDGDVPDLPRFIEVKDRHEAFLMVDEAHSFGTLGATGRGIAEHFGVDPSGVEIWMGTLSKSLASCGGYIAGASRLVSYLKYSAPGFVFSVGIPPPSAAAALAALRLIRAEPQRVTTLRARSRAFLELAREHGLRTGLSEASPVIPVILGSSQAAIVASNRLLARGINVQPIVYPAVEEGMARLRFFMCAAHTEEQISSSVRAVAEVVAELQVSSDPTVEGPPASLEMSR